MLEMSGEDIIEGTLISLQNIYERNLDGLEKL